MTSSVSAHFTAIAGLAWDVLLILIDILEISRIHSLPQVWTSAFVTNIKISKHLRLRKTNAPDVAYSGSRRQRSSCPNPCSAETTIGNTTFCRGLGPIWNTVSFRNIFNDPTGEKNQNLYSMNSMRTSAIFRTFWRFAFLAQSSPRKPCVHRHDFPYYTVCFYTAKQGRVRCRLRPAAASLLVFRSWEKKAEMHSSSLSGLKKLELSFWFYDSTYDWLPLSLLKDYYKFIHIMIMEFIDNYNNFIHMTIQWLPLSILPVWWMMDVLSPNFLPILIRISLWLRPASSGSMYSGSWVAHHLSRNPKCVMGQHGNSNGNSKHPGSHWGSNESIWISRISNKKRGFWEFKCKSCTCPSFSNPRFSEWHRRGDFRVPYGIQIEAQGLWGGHLLPGCQ